MVVCRVPFPKPTSQLTKNEKLLKKETSTHIQSTQTVERFFTCKAIRALPNLSPMSFIFSSPSLSCSSTANRSASHSKCLLIAFMMMFTTASRGVSIIWNKRKATMVGGWAEISLEKPKDRRRGGAWRKAGKRARMVKIWICETAINFVG